MIAAFAVTSALGFVFGIEAEVKQRVVVLAGDHDHVAAVAAVAAAGAAARNELLAPERKAAVAAVAGFDVDVDFIDKQRGECRRAWTSRGSEETTIRRLRC